MKTYNLKNIGVLLLTFILFGSCNEDNLNQQNPNGFLEVDFWKTETDAEKGIIGTYAAFTNIWYYRRFEIFLSDYRDDVVNGFGTSERTGPGYFNGISSGNASRWVWSAMYQGVSRANAVLANVPSISMGEAKKSAILGEAYFLRAYNYFCLVNNYQNIPLHLTPEDGSDPKTTVQADPLKVWEQIIDDFRMSSTLLPDSWNDGNVGRVTNATALAYLGKSLLYDKQYAEAAIELKKVVDNPNYGLVADYADNFSSETENNKESLFEIQLNKDGVTGWGADNAASGKQNSFTSDIAAPPSYTGQDGMEINSWLLDLYLDEKTINGQIDPRAFSTIIFNSEETTTYRGKTLKSTYFEGKTYAAAFPANPAGTKIYGKKYLEVDKFKDANSFAASSNNLRLMRFADVLLMYAEAEMMNNGGNATQVAVDAVNLVRKRADMSEFTTSMTMKDLEEERIKELSLERTRYFDLLRWGKVVERIVRNPQFKSNSGGTESYKEGREYMDIPQTELDVNKLFKHNKGY